jgi:hypothetical protein
VNKTIAVGLFTENAGQFVQLPRSSAQSLKYNAQRRSFWPLTLLLMRCLMMAFGLMLGFFDYRLEKVQSKFKRQGFSCESARRALLVKPIKHGRERSGQRLRPMLLTIAVAVGSIVSLVIAFFLRVSVLLAFLGGFSPLDGEPGPVGVTRVAPLFYVAA